MDNNYVTVSKIKWYAMKVLPLVYDDSLSYYEILSKVATKVNNLIENDEQEIQALEELSASVEGLDTRVTQNTSDISALETALENAIDTLETYVQNYVTDPEHFADNPLEGYILTVTDEGTLEWVSPYTIIGSLPEGGTTGQALVKHSDTDFDTEWNGYVAPDGGTEGQVLMKNSDENGDIGWGDVTEQGTIPTARLIPSGGNEGDVLVKVSDDNYDVAWDTGFKPQIIVSAENGSTVQVGQQVTETADIISYNSATKSLIGLTANIKARQDLHNQSSPYPEGGGKNKLPLVLADIKSWNTGGTWSDNVYSFNDLTFTINADEAGNITGIKVNGTSSLETSFWFSIASLTNGESYIISSGASGGSSSTYMINIPTNPPSGGGDPDSFTFTYDSTKETRARILVRTSTALSNVMFYPMIRRSTEADATFAPYSNICPIVGYTGANITRCGKNIANMANSVYAFDSSTHSFTTSGGAFNRDIFTGTGGGDTAVSLANLSRLPFLKAGTYHVSFTTSVDTSINVKTVDDNGTVKTLIALGRTGGTITLTKDTRVTFRVDISNAVTFTDFQIELGSSATPYEAYNGTVYNISWSDDAGTVYFGTLTYQGNSIWKLVVLGVIKNMGDLTFTREYYATYQSYYFRTTLTPNPTGSYILCSTYAPKSAYGDVLQNDKTIALTGSWYANGLIVRDDTYTDKDTFTTAVTGQTVLYQLATPIEYTLTEDALTELVGTNNIFTDVGDITAILDSYKNGTEVNGLWTLNVNSYGIYKVRAIKNNITKNAIVTVDTVKQYPVDLT